MIPNLTPVVLVKDDIYWLPYALECIRGYFDKVVMYDMCSIDGTADVLDYYKTVFEGDGTKVIAEHFPEIEPRGQIMARNAMIAEAGTDYYFILDGDELWPKSSLDYLSSEFANMVYYKALYGIVNRTEVRADLTSAYSPETFVNHHRVYHRTATWAGKHPGEAPRIAQKSSNEYKFDETVELFHFHNALRSPVEADVPSRLKRKSQHTYHPGQVSSINLFDRLPILKKPIHNFPVNPMLALLQAQHDPV